MPTAEESRRRAEEAEHQAERLPDGFERNEHIRKAAAWREIAELLDEQERRRGGD
jgi:hypothetical protein